MNFGPGTGNNPVYQTQGPGSMGGNTMFKAAGGALRNTGMASLLPRRRR